MSNSINNLQRMLGNDTRLTIEYLPDWMSDPPQWSIAWWGLHDNPTAREFQMFRADTLNEAFQDAINYLRLTEVMS